MTFDGEIMMSKDPLPHTILSRRDEVDLPLWHDSRPESMLARCLGAPEKFKALERWGQRV